MSIDRMINVLVTITLIQMMVAIGLGVTLAQVVDVARNRRLVARAALANYVLVPAALLSGCCCCSIRPLWSPLGFSLPPSVPAPRMARPSPAWREAMCQFRWA